MSPTGVLILGHSFIAVYTPFFVKVFATNLHIDGDLSIKWHGIRGRTISKVIRCDPGIVETFAPEIVVIQLGTNQLSRTYLVCCMSHTVCKRSVFARLFFAVIICFI